MKLLRILLIFTLIPSLLASSSKKPSERYLSFAKVINVDLGKGKANTLKKLPLDEEKFDVIGLLDVKVWNDYIMFATTNPSGYIKVFDKKSGRCLGSFLKQGNGPGELRDPVFFSSVYFDGPVASVNDSRGGIVDLNIPESCKQGKAQISVRNDCKASTKTHISSVIPIQGDTLLCAEIAMPPLGYNRFISINGERIVLPSQEKLNNVRATKDDGPSFNMFFGSAVYNKSRKLVVEASAILNTIQMYSLDGRVEKTICIGEKPDNVLAIERLSSSKQPESFGSLRPYDSGFGIIYFNTTNIDTQTVRSKKPSLLFFDWDGKLLFNYSFPVWVSSFDIDWNDKVIYAVDYNEERIYKFALPS